jgi:hypothetical protein
MGRGGAARSRRRAAAQQQWPGNVRELASAPSAGGVLRMARSAASGARGVGSRPTASIPLRLRGEAPAARGASSGCSACRGNLAEVARRQGSRGAVIYRAQKHGLLPKRARAAARARPDARALRAPRLALLCVLSLTLAFGAGMLRLRSDAGFRAYVGAEHRPCAPSTPSSRASAAGSRSRPSGAARRCACAERVRCAGARDGACGRRRDARDARRARGGEPRHERCSFRRRSPCARWPPTGRPVADRDRLRERAQVDRSGSGPDLRRCRRRRA